MADIPTSAFLEKVFRSSCGRCLGLVTDQFIASSSYNSSYSACSDQLRMSSMFLSFAGVCFFPFIFFEKKNSTSPPLLSCSTSFGPFLGRLISYRQATLAEQPVHAWSACCWLCMCCWQLDYVNVATHTDCLCNGHVRFILFHTHTKDILEI